MPILHEQAGGSSAAYARFPSFHGTGAVVILLSWQEAACSAMSLPSPQPCSHGWYVPCYEWLRLREAC